MIKNKCKKFFLFFIVVLFIMISIISSIMTNNHIHINNCDVDECPICIMIHFSTEIIDIMILTSIELQIIECAILIALFIKDNNNRKKELTLVDLKIIQNN